ncbi:hypothetical protein TCON_1798 [Astathelohania contejeani]|uniref:Uncharacterized protein n=1 Tax=Astathelohania contejeani TaxID=164912 RepID=A0ABQ7HXS5_9MICR|nr:hypothetical protein TCON_1798 [Thelohania contejeani]
MLLLILLNFIMCVFAEISQDSKVELLQIVSQKDELHQDEFRQEELQKIELQEDENMMKALDGIFEDIINDEFSNENGIFIIIESNPVVNKEEERAFCGESKEESSADHDTFTDEEKINNKKDSIVKPIDENNVLKEKKEFSESDKESSTN